MQVEAGFRIENGISYFDIREQGCYSSGSLYPEGVLTGAGFVKDKGEWRIAQQKPLALSAFCE